MKRVSVTPSTELTCYHCGEACRNRDIIAGHKYFCCEGCKMVYEILHSNGMCTYYDLNNNPGQTQKIAIRKDKFLFLDDAGIQQALISFKDELQTHVSFYLPQMHCSSCLFSALFWFALCRNRWETLIPVQYSRSKIYSFRKNFLATGFFHLRFSNGNFCFFYCSFYSRFWKIVLRMGMPTNQFHGNDVQKSGVLGIG